MYIASTHNTAELSGKWHRQRPMVKIFHETLPPRDEADYIPFACSFVQY